MPRALKSHKFFLYGPGRSMRSDGSRLMGINYRYEGDTKNITLKDLIGFLEENGIDPSRVPLPSDFMVSVKKQEVPVATDKYPPIAAGTLVTTTQPNMALRKEWTQEAWEARKWRVSGVVITHHDSHGLCYEVRHADRTVGCYDPSEIEVTAIHDKCGHPIFAGKCVHCDLGLREPTPISKELQPGDSGIHDKCGYPIRNGKCIYCDR